MNMLKNNVKKIILLMISCLIMTSCDNVNNPKGTKLENNDEVIVVESDPGENKSFFNVYDSNLNLKSKLSTKHSVIGTNGQALAINDNKAYITMQNDNSYKGSDELLVYSLKDFKEENIDLKSTKADALLVDDKYVYTSFNWDEGVFIYRQNKDGSNPVKKIIDKDHNGVVTNMVKNDDKIYLIYQNMAEKCNYVRILSEKNLDTIDTIALDKGYFATYNSIMYNNGNLYMVGGTDSSDNYRSILSVVNIEKSSVENFTSDPVDFMEILEANDKNKLLIFACEDTHSSTSKSYAYEFDKLDKKLVKLNTYDTPIMRAIAYKGQYMAIGFGNVYKIGSDYKIIKKVKTESDYNTLIFER